MKHESNLKNKSNNAGKWVGEDLNEEYDIVSEAFQCRIFSAVLSQHGRRAVENSSIPAEHRCVVSSYNDKLLR